MGAQANVVALVDDFTNDEYLDGPRSGINPHWKRYSLRFGDSYTTGGEEITGVLDDFPHHILISSVTPTVVASTSHGPYITSFDEATGKVQLFKIHVDDFLIEEVGNATDVYSGASDCLTVQVSVYGY